MKKYHCVINGTAVDGIEDSSIDGLYNTIDENGYLEKLVDELERGIPSLKEPVCEGFSWSFIEEIQEYIGAVYKNQTAILLDEEGHAVKSFLLQTVLKELCENYYAGENGCLQAGRIWSAQLGSFIEQGKWMVALESEDGKTIVDLDAWPNPIIIGEGRVEWKKGEDSYTPILWYGIEDQPISDIWTIRNNTFPAIVPEKYGMGAYGAQMRIDGFELNYPLLFDDGSVESWYFASLGEEGADFSKLLTECPINLKEFFETKNGNEQVANYCYRLQSEP